MRLKSEDAGLFYELFLPLLDYVNENYHVIEEPIRFTGESVDPRDAAEVAHFLWERTWIIDDYLTGSDLPEECQNILSSWKRCISGTFIIEQKKDELIKILCEKLKLSDNFKKTNSF